MEILNGKKLAKKIQWALAEKVKNFSHAPHLAVVLVGENPASRIYVWKKIKICKKIGITSSAYMYPDTFSQESLIEKINELNADDSVHAILVQLPLPPHIDSQMVINSIDPQKDADGFTPESLGKIFTEKNFWVSPPATPMGIMQIFDHYDIALSGKNVVVIGRSNIVGKPLALMLIARGATVTSCNSQTSDMWSFTLRADILVVAAGVAHLIDKSMVKENCVIIDVWIHRDEDNKIIGDVDFESVKDYAWYVTPVPWGVGPMTVAQLMLNTVALYEKYHLVS